MRALIFSDLHNHTYQEFSTLIEGTNSRLLEHISCMDRIAADAKDYEVDAIFFTGDVYHLKNYVDSQVIRLTMEKFRKLSEIAPLIVCPGNHDYKGWGADPVLLEVIREFVKEVHTGDEILCGGWKIRIFPYVRNIDELNARLQDYHYEEKTIGLFHQDIVGQQYGKFLVEKGLDSKQISEKFVFSFVGHFHSQKQIEKNVWSVGSPLMISFSETDHTKGWLILDTELGEVLPIVNTESPKFRALTITSDTPLDDVSDKDKDFFRIEVEGPTIPDLSSFKWKRVKQSTLTGKKRRTDISFSDSNQTIVEKYVKSRKPPLDEKALIEAGMRYVQ